MINTDKALERVSEALATCDELVLREVVEDLFPQMLNEIVSLRTAKTFLETENAELELRLKELEE
jgi:hypothetical protein